MKWTRKHESEYSEREYQCGNILHNSICTPSIGNDYFLLPSTTGRMSDAYPLPLGSSKKNTHLLPHLRSFNSLLHRFYFAFPSFPWFWRAHQFISLWSLSAAANTSTLYADASWLLVVILYMIFFCNPSLLCGTLAIYCPHSALCHSRFPFRRNTSLRPAKTSSAKILANFLPVYHFAYNCAL